MGCNNSKAKGIKADTSTNEAAQFLDLANNQRHPVAQKLLNEWTLFVDAQVKRSAGDHAAVAAFEARPKEIWADTEARPVTHRSADQVGKTFLQYIKSDLSQRGWGGNFDYKVAGVANQGFLKANANIDTASSATAEDIVWETKIHYHSSGAS